MAVEKETQLEAWFEENMPEPGGNPNYVETINGTVANPWGSYSLQQIIDGLKSNQLSVKMSMDDQTFVVPTVLEQFNGLVFSVLVVMGTNPAINGVSVLYVGDDVQVFIVEGNDSNYTVTSEDLTTPCTLAITHHPLPEN